MSFLQYPDDGVPAAGVPLSRHRTIRREPQPCELSPQQAYRPSAERHAMRVTDLHHCGGGDLE
ncbi:MAG: hypothetical protein GVY09_03485 [Gammaproteobacteria bacterium]|jgi:hypothetical protein|nr:hypothetical protein [Gammaproteobacteria bacterium]